ncbi:aldose 1-epimerase family protein [Streptococcus cameli]
MKYILENEHLTIAFDSFGGALTSIKNKTGLEYLWQGDPAYWSGQAPVLFPICGSLRENQAQTQTGERISMPRHGIVRKEEFICKEQTANRIVFSISATENMLKQYPFPFTLSISYELKENQLEAAYHVLNQSDKEMPFFIGGHPGFRCPLEEGLDFSDYAIFFDKTEEQALPACEVETGLVNRLKKRVVDFDGRTLPLQHNLFERDALILANSHSKKVSLASEKGQHEIEMAFSDFPNLLIWSAANKAPFVALEPMVGLSTYTDEGDIFEEKEHVQWASPKEEKVYRYTITFS